MYHLHGLRESKIKGIVQNSNVHHIIASTECPPSLQSKETCVKKHTTDHTPPPSPPASSHHYLSPAQEPWHQVRADQKRPKSVKEVGAGCCMSTAKASPRSLSRLSFYQGCLSKGHWNWFQCLRCRTWCSTESRRVQTLPLLWYEAGGCQHGLVNKWMAHIEQVDEVIL